MRAMKAGCIICGSQNLFRADRCDPCYRHLRKHGQDRPEADVVSINRRRLDRELERRALRRIVSAGEQA